MTAEHPSKPRSFLADVAHEAGKDAVTRHAAALAYFAVLAMPGLLVLVLAVAGGIYDFDAVRGRLVDEMRGLLGAEGGKTVESMIASASQPKGSSVGARVLGV